MEFRILGPLQVLDGEREVAVPATLVRTVLTVLLLNHGRTVTVEQLKSRLWIDPPADPRGTVQTYVRRLRAVIGADLVQTRPRGYLMNDPPSDLTEFRRLAGAAYGAKGPAKASELLAAALQLWRGDPFSDLASEALPHDKTALIDEKLTVVERWAEAGLELGGHRDLVANLAVLTRDHPLRERLRALLMVALFRCDRTAEALTVYDELAVRLANQLGIDPGPELRRLRQAVLTNDPQLHAGLLTSKSTSRGWTPQCRLPPEVRTFIGRTEQTDQVCELLSNGLPVLGICGAPGTGKSALALRIAHRLRHSFPDGQWHVRLGASSGPRSASDAFLELLRLCGVTECSGLRNDPETLSAELRSHLADRRVLLILDDALRADQVRPMLPGTGGSAVIVTSQQDLTGLTALDGGHVVQLDPLTDCEAVDLLRAFGGRPALTADDRDLHTLARLCDRLPLALRIAAANLGANPARPVAEYAEELSSAPDRLDKLAIAGDGEASVRAAFDTAYLRLDECGRRWFRILGALPVDDHTPASAAAALGVADGEKVLLDLTAAGLLRRLGNARFGFHSLLALYAAEVSSGWHTMWSCR